MAISNKILSQVPAEDEFSSTSSRHILVEDGGIIKRLNKAGLKELPVVTSEDAGKVVVVDGKGNYVLKKIDTNYIVDITFGPNNTAISDKTYEEILDAYNTGYTIIFSIKSYGSRIFVEKTEDSFIGVLLYPYNISGTDYVQNITELATLIVSITTKNGETVCQAALGSSKFLPIVSSEDSGKILKVMNGEWAVATV